MNPKYYNYFFIIFLILIITFIILSIYINVFFLSGAFVCFCIAVFCKHKEVKLIKQRTLDYIERELDILKQDDNYIDIEKLDYSDEDTEATEVYSDEDLF